ncbi:conjugal transfer protein TraF [Simiduia agarivorans]|uniref:Conjugal transfer protein TraF n=1 Tax=Simiduia agarivorans (strain DSM 21679 / JCM 13881 / BCRC 17597 / SA1) TaxID=1117647 RepID=K4KMM3_SIMAS|nr:conjugal transfer protein TraF [Simiduia agarivorans]AFU99475.1 hypothetical protein M5M_11490 [Simiduia agarivorans SA1 = DSM 21679]
MMQGIKWRLATALVAAASINAQAGNGFAGTGPAATMGSAVTGHYLSDAINPANVGFDRQQISSTSFSAGRLHLSGGLEYGNVQELFDGYDELSAWLKDNDSGGNNGGGGNPDQPPKPIDPIDPDLERIIEEFKAEATRIGAILAVIATEGYANTDLGTDLALVFNREWLGGTWGLDVSYAGSASAVGFVEDLDFNAEQALTELQAAYNLQPGDPATSFDLSGGIILHIDPNAGTVRGEFNNDSLLAIRAARETTVALNYSRAFALGDQQWFVGVRPKYVNMGLSGLITRIGDITDSESLFDDIRDADFNNTGNLSLDAGVLWASDHYTAGLAVTDIFEPTYDFNFVGSTGFNNPVVVAAFERLQTFKQARRWRLDSSYISDNKQWAASVSVDANAVRDALGENHQWANVSGSWKPDSFWIPSVRLGYSANLAGTHTKLYKLGLTFFNHLDLDLGLSQDTVRINGDTLPRGLNVSLGFSYGF